MYKIIENDREKISLDDESFNDYLIESLKTRGARDKDIEKIENDLEKLKNKEKYTVWFDGKEIFVVIK